MRLALLQTAVVASKADNLANAARRVRGAAQQGAQMAVLPEMFCCPYADKAFVENAEPAGGPAWQALSRIAAENGLWLVGGSLPEREGARLYNSSFVFAPDGRQVARHRKLHLFDIDVQGGQRFRESDTFSPGGELTLFDTPFGRMGLCICFDMRFPELSRLLALRGAKLILAPAAFNMTTGPAHWELLFRQRAVDNQLFTAGVAPARDKAGAYVSYAHSLLCNPWGQVVCRATTGEESLLYDVDFRELDAVRAQLPLLSARRKDLYALLDPKCGDRW